MAFPHKTDSFPNLAKAVELPDEKNMQNQTDSENIRKKRRRRKN
jgi:uncharacterized 2Fe-2S/4Fe-4S cluster protein (DUF4445 family)